MKDKKAGEVSYHLSVAPLFARPLPLFPGNVKPGLIKQPICRSFVLNSENLCVLCALCG
jgi:hypothetical protein